jgi:hypothetical protein
MMSVKDMSHHIANYRNIFIYLLIGTALTVIASYMDFNVQDSIAGAIFYWILLLTVFFLALLLFIPLLWDLNNMSNQINY